jgi:hypothetical protein
MRSIFNNKDRRELHHRIDNLRPHSRARWEQRRPPASARVLLQVAEEHPEAIPNTLGGS